MAVEVSRWWFTGDDLERMAWAGILSPGDRVELIEGEIVRMSAQGSRHILSVNRFTRDLVLQLGDAGMVSVQNAVRLTEYLEPQPDLAVLRLRPDYATTKPRAADVLLLIEVSDTTLEYDRGVKLPLYAKAGIPEVWIADLTGEVIDRHIDPSGGMYRSVTRAGKGETLRSISRPAITIDVAAVLG
jgi:Uma2 family endonuclease